MEASALRRPGAALLPRSRRIVAAFGDDRLVEQIRRGNEVAFEVAYDRHHRGILSFCRHMLGSREEAEDAVQQTFASAFNDLQSNDREIKLKAWLYTIARNRCLSMLRARREQPAEIDDMPTAGLSDEVQQRADLRELLHDLRELPEEQREALVLCELGDLSHAEVGNVIGVEPVKVKALVFQARSTLIENREARAIPCQEIREQLATATGGALRRGPLRRHLKACDGCRDYRDQVRVQRRALALVLPVVPSAGLKDSVLAAFGAGGGAGGAGVAGGAAGGAAGAAAGGSGAMGGGGLITAFAGAGAAKMAVVGTLALGVVASGGVLAVDRAAEDEDSGTAQAVGSVASQSGSGTGLGQVGASGATPIASRGNDESKDSDDDGARGGDDSDDEKGHSRSASKGRSQGRSHGARGRSKGRSRGSAQSHQQSGGLSRSGGRQGNNGGRQSAPATPRQPQQVNNGTGGRGGNTSAGGGTRSGTGSGGSGGGGTRTHTPLDDIAPESVPTVPAIPTGERQNGTAAPPAAPLPLP